MNTPQNNKQFIESTDKLIVNLNNQSQGLLNLIEKLENKTKDTGQIASSGQTDIDYPFKIGQLKAKLSN